MGDVLAPNHGTRGLTPSVGIQPPWQEVSSAEINCCLVHLRKGPHEAKVRYTSVDSGGACNRRSLWALCHTNEKYWNMFSLPQLIQKGVSGLASRVAKIGLYRI